MTGHKSPACDGGDQKERDSESLLDYLLSEFVGSNGHEFNELVYAMLKCDDVPL